MLTEQNVQVLNVKRIQDVRRLGKGSWVQGIMDGSFEPAPRSLARSVLDKAKDVFWA